jgi:equilibrative nucleoside transporter 1/2/3
LFIPDLQPMPIFSRINKNQQNNFEMTNSNQMVLGNAPLRERQHTSDQEDDPQHHHRSSWSTLVAGAKAYSRVPSADLQQEQDMSHQYKSHASMDATSMHLPLWQEPPTDRYRLTWLIFFALGVGMLFPWNVFINANTYFKLRFTGSSYADNFPNYFSIGFMISNVLWLAVALKTTKESNSYSRILVALVVNGLVFLVNTLLTRVAEVDAYLYFYAAMVMVAVSGGSTAFLQNGVFALASNFPPIYTQAVMSGQGLAGTAVAVSQILTLVAADEEASSDAYFSAFLYFLIATMVIAVCLVGAGLLRSLDTYKYHVQMSTRFIKSEEEEPIMASSQDSTAASTAFIQDTSLSHWQVFLRLLPLASSVFLVFCVTLTLFPSILALIEPVDSGDRRTNKDRLFIAIAFLVFSLGDWLGKSLPGFPKLPLPIRLFGRAPDGRRKYLNYSTITSTTAILVLSVLRLIFIPLFLFSNVVLHDASGMRLPRNDQLPYVFASNEIYILFLVIFSASNGWLGSLAMMQGPSRVSNAQDKEVAGTMMVFCLTTGLAVGSMISFLARSAVCQWCNPFQE